MAKLQISGAYILKYPDIAAFLQEHNIAIRDVRYVDVKMKERFVPADPHSLNGVTVKEVEATIILHDGTHMPCPLERLIYNG